MLKDGRMAGVRETAGDRQTMGGCWPGVVGARAARRSGVTGDFVRGQTIGGDEQRSHGMADGSWAQIFLLPSSKNCDRGILRQQACWI